MKNFLRNRGSSISTVVFVLLIIAIMQSSISYTTAFGKLDYFVRHMRYSWIPAAWLAVRVFLIVVMVALWLLNRKLELFRAIILVNSLLTLGLVMNMVILMSVLSGFASQDVKSLLVDVLLMAVTNILIFSIWYWLIDPPGIAETHRADEPWDFLFPQRGNSIPHYEAWLPRYTDYLYLAFTTSFAFSPTDTMPLTRRAKLLMLLQSTVSIITLTGIASSAINILAGSGGSIGG